MLTIAITAGNLMMPMWLCTLVNMIAFFIGTRMCVIGLTGGIACGKTTCGKILKKHGFTIVDSDEINSELLENDQGLKNEIKRHFPEAVVENKVDRQKLGEIIFSDYAKRKTLNKLTHKRIFKQIIK